MIRWLNLEQPNIEWLKLDPLNLERQGLKDNVSKKPHCWMNEPENRLTLNIAWISTYVYINRTNNKQYKYTLCKLLHKLNKCGVVAALTDNFIS